jgi:hypothetical protein
VSDAVHDLLRGSIEQSARDLGPLRLKNSKNPVRAYSLYPDTLDANVAAARVPAFPAIHARTIAVAAIMLVLLGGLGASFFLIYQFSPGRSAEAHSTAPIEVSHGAQPRAEVAASAGPVGAERGAQPGEDIDRQYWNSIKSSTDPAEFRAYMARFPNGIFFASARIQISRLLTALPPQGIISREPPMSTMHSGDVVLVDDGTCPGGMIKKIISGENERGIPRTRTCILWKRPTSQEATEPRAGSSER